MPDTLTPVPSAANGPAGPPDGGERIEGELAEIVAEWIWFYAHVNDGRFDRYAGEHVAIYQKTVVDHDADLAALKHRAADALRVPTYRVACPYVEPPLVVLESE